MNTIKRYLLLVSGAILLAFNVNTFIKAGELIPGGFTGVTLLIQECARRFFNLEIPFSVVFFILNAVPAFISFRFIGKWYSIYSCIVIVLSGLLTDFMPPMFIELIQVHDTLLSSVFGGLINALAISLCLHAGATSGGSDFIAIAITEKLQKNGWHYILAGNCVILVFAGALFNLDTALYSIIFQFTSTMGINALYKGYQQMTMLIVTSKPDEIYELIKKETNHAATSFTGTGYYEKSDRVMLYSVVSATEVNNLIVGIKKIDSGAFINVIKTEELRGRFYRPPRI